MFVTHFLLQRRSVRLLDTAVTSREFFKRRWLDKVLSKSSLTSATMPSSSVNVQIDARETALISALTKMAPSAPFSTSQLSEGDIIVAQSNRRIVIERKSVDDFYNSVRTNRLFDQIGRIFESFSQHPRSDNRMVLVLEGSCRSPAIDQTVMHMYHSLLLRDRIPVIRTDSVEDTAKLILSLGSRMGKLFSSPNEFAALVHVERSGRQTSGLNVPYLKLLMSIRGVSAARANAIAATFPSMDLLVTALKDGDGTVKLAQLVCARANRSVGSSLGFATALNVAEALLGPAHPEVAIGKLVKYLSPVVKNGEALRIAKSFGSIAGLRLAYLNAGLGGQDDGLPEAVKTLLAESVDEPNTLLAGLRGVRLISPKTAELLTIHFSNIRKLHAVVSRASSREEVVTMLRMVGTASQKRMIAKQAVENAINWLQIEGFIPNLDISH